MDNKIKCSLFFMIIFFINMQILGNENFNKDLQILAYEKKYLALQNKIAKYKKKLPTSFYTSIFEKLINSMSSKEVELDDKFRGKMIQVLGNKKGVNWSNFNLEEIKNLPDDNDLTRLILFLKDKGANINVREKTLKITPFMIACQKGRKDVIATLLKLGANINAEDKIGNNALFYSLTNPQIFSLLLRNGIEMETSKKSALWEVLKNNNQFQIITLIKNGANKAYTVKGQSIKELFNDNHRDLKTILEGIEPNDKKEKIKAVNFTKLLRLAIISHDNLVVLNEQIPEKDVKKIIKLMSLFDGQIATIILNEKENHISIPKNPPLNIKNLIQRIKASSNILPENIFTIIYSSPKYHKIANSITKTLENDGFGQSIVITEE